VNISAIITDNIEINDIYLDITYPDSRNENISILVNNTGDTYYCNKSYSNIGTYGYFIWANDASGNSVTSSTQYYAIGDDIPPVLTSILFKTSTNYDTNPDYGWINISCEASDNTAINNVCINIIKPDLSQINESMIYLNGDTYYYNTSSSFTGTGNYSYFIWVDDTSGNTDISNDYDISIPANWDIDMNGYCTLMDLNLISNHYGEIGSNGWIREDIDNNGVIQVLDLVLVSSSYGETWFK
jgi:hypothetical protein